MGKGREKQTPNPKPPTPNDLEIWHHQFHSFLVGLADNSFVRQIALPLGRFVFEQVVFEGFATHDFTATRLLESLSGGFPGFQFGHERSLIQHDL